MPSCGPRVGMSMFWQMMLIRKADSCVNLILTVLTLVRSNRPVKQTGLVYLQLCA